MNGEMSETFKESLDCYRRLKLETISSDWTDQIWEGNFCEEVEEIPETVLKAHLDELSSVVEVTRKWTDKNSDKSKGPIVPTHCYTWCELYPVITGIDGASAVDALESTSPGFWTLLCKAHISHKTLLAVIYTLLDRTKVVTHKK